MMQEIRNHYAVNNDSLTVYGILRAELLQAGCECPKDTPIFSDAAFMTNLDSRPICDPRTGAFYIAGICKGCRRIVHRWIDLNDETWDIRLFDESYSHEIYERFFEVAMATGRRYSKCRHHLGISTMVHVNGREGFASKGSGLYFRHLVGCFKCKFTMEIEVPQGSMRSLKDFVR